MLGPMPAVHQQLRRRMQHNELPHRLHLWRTCGLGGSALHGTVRRPLSSAMMTSLS